MPITQPPLRGHTTRQHLDALTRVTDRLPDGVRVDAVTLHIPGVGAVTGHHRRNGTWTLYATSGRAQAAELARLMGLAGPTESTGIDGPRLAWVGPGVEVITWTPS